MTPIAMIIGEIDHCLEQAAATTDRLERREYIDRVRGLVRTLRAMVEAEKVRVA